MIGGLIIGDLITLAIGSSALTLIVWVFIVNIRHIEIDQYVLITMFGNNVGTIGKADKYRGPFFLPKGLFKLTIVPTTQQEVLIPGPDHLIQIGNPEPGKPRAQITEGNVSQIFIPTGIYTDEEKKFLESKIDKNLLKENPFFRQQMTVEIRLAMTSWEIEDLYIFIQKEGRSVEANIDEVSKKIAKLLRNAVEKSVGTHSAAFLFAFREKINEEIFAELDKTTRNLGVRIIRELTVLADVEPARRVSEAQANLAKDELEARAKKVTAEAEAEAIRRLGKANADAFAYQTEAEAKGLEQKLAVIEKDTSGNWKAVLVTESWTEVMEKLAASPNTKILSLSALGNIAAELSESGLSGMLQSTKP